MNSLPCCMTRRPRFLAERAQFDFRGFPNPTNGSEILKPTPLSPPAPDTFLLASRPAFSAHRLGDQAANTGDCCALARDYPCAARSGARTVDNLPRRAEHRIHGCQPPGRSPCQAVRRAGRVALQARWRICGRSRHNRHRLCNPVESDRLPRCGPSTRAGAAAELQITRNPI